MRRTRERKIHGKTDTKRIKEYANSYCHAEGFTIHTRFSCLCEAEPNPESAFCRK